MRTTNHEVSNEEDKERNGCGEGHVNFGGPSSRHDHANRATADTGEEAD